MQGSKILRPFFNLTVVRGVLLKVSLVVVVMARVVECQNLCNKPSDLVSSWTFFVVLLSSTRCVQSMLSRFCTVHSILSSAVPLMNLCNIENKSLGTQRIEPGAAGWEAQTQPLCYAPLSPLQAEPLCVLKFGSTRGSKFSKFWFLELVNALWEELFCECTIEFY